MNENLIERMRARIAPEEIAKAEMLRDACAFGQIIDHYLFDPEINMIITVNAPLVMTEVCALLSTAQPESFDATLLEEMIHAGAVNLCFPEKRENPKAGVVGLCFAEIGRRRKVYVVRCIPFYIIEITQDLWQ